MNPQEFALQRLHANEYDKPEQDFLSLKKIVSDILFASEMTGYLDGKIAHRRFGLFETSESEQLFYFWSSFVAVIATNLLFYFGMSSKNYILNPAAILSEGLRFIFLFAFLGLFAYRTSVATKNAIQSSYQVKSFFQNPLNNDKYLVGKAVKLYNQRADLFQDLVKCVHRGTAETTEAELRETHSALKKAYETISESLQEVNSAIEDEQSLARLQRTTLAQSRQSLAEAIFSLEAMSSKELLEQETLLLEAHAEIEEDCRINMPVL